MCPPVSEDLRGAAGDLDDVAIEGEEGGGGMRDEGLGRRGGREERREGSRRKER